MKKYYFLILTVLSVLLCTITNLFIYSLDDIFTRIFTL